MLPLFLLNVNFQSNKYLSNFFPVHPRSFVYVVFQTVPKVLHIGIAFQLPRRFDIFDAIFCDALGKLVENHGVHALVLVVFVYGNQKQINSVVMV